jgi:NADPH2:quinone reductase
MRAMICRQWGPPESLRLENIERPSPGAGQVRIAVRAAGVSFATSLVIAGKYQRKPPFPFAPGTEISGTIVETGKDVQRFRVGDAVYATIDWGGCAEEAIAHEVNVFPRPAAVGWTEAIPLAISYPTAGAALLWPQFMDLQAGEWLLVHAAAGGVGLAAVEIAKAIGARVIATAGGAEKTAFVRSRGADHVIDYRAGPFREEVLRLTDGRGVNAVLDPVGGEVFTESLRCMAPEARICPIGFAGGAIPTIPANILLVKNLTVVGCNLGYYMGWSPYDARFEHADRMAALHRRLCEWVEAGKLRPHVGRTFHRLEDVPAAIRCILDRQVLGRVAIEMA